MGLHTSTKGLTLPIKGAPVQKVEDTKKVTEVAILADDFPAMKPRFFAREGDTVKRGELIFTDRKLEGVRHTAPAAGTIKKINRGARRALRSVVIELSEAELNGDGECAEFEAYAPGDLNADQVRALLLESGAWTSFRTRPFGHTPEATSSPAAIFVNGMDTGPLAADPAPLMAEEKKALDTGLSAIAKLSEGKTYFCVAPGTEAAQGLEADVSVEEFAGPHPAGTTGFHIHTLLPAHRERVIWTVSWQQVISIGHLILTGKLHAERVVALSGPGVKSPRLIRTRAGARLSQLVRDELHEGEQRIISGDVLSGAAAVEADFDYLGSRANQVSVLPEAGERKFLGWLGPGLESFSILPTFVAKWLGKKSYDFTTDTNGSPRAMVPIGMYEEVTPFDILPTHLLRALLVGDVEMAEKLGALELDEEDVAVFSFVCPGKTNYGTILRANLERMSAEG